MKHIFTSLSLGSDTVKVVVCELFNNKLNVLAASSIKSKGIKRGLITDAVNAATCIKQAVSEVEAMIGAKIRRVIAGVPSYLAEFILISSEMRIDNEKGIINKSDISKITQKAIKTKLAPDKEVVTIVPIDFNLDGRSGILSPIGLSARKISMRAIMVTTPLKNIYSVATVLENIGLEIADISLDCIGDINTFRNKEIDNKIGAIINIGAEVTQVSLYNKGIAIKNSILNIGGKNIDSDLSYMFKITLDEAKAIKEKFAVASTRYASSTNSHEITTVYGEKIKVSQLAASEIIEARVEEILNLAKKEINSLTNRQIEYIIITGGTSNLNAIDVVVDKIFEKKAIIGNVKMIGLRNNRYASTLGNIIYYIDTMKIKNKENTMINEDEMINISSRVNKTSGDTMLGNVVNYYLNE